MPKPTTTKGGGQNVAFPDTCHLPAPPPPAGPGGIPTPYPNKSSCSDTSDTTSHVFIAKKEVAIDGSAVSSSQGDEPGCSNLPTPKGLMSQTNTGKTKYTSYSSKVKMEGKGVVSLGCSTEQNGPANMNAKAGKQAIPGQVKVLNN
jgi:hypothetical protein